MLSVGESPQIKIVIMVSAECVVDMWSVDLLMTENDNVEVKHLTSRQEDQLSVWCENSKHHLIPLELLPRLLQFCQKAVKNCQNAMKYLESKCNEDS
ncbi:hypothetical protein Tco_0862644 [Tanacetum coccineum]